MPIYEYRCSKCGHQAEVLQKLSDPVLTVCTACGKPTFTKQLSAAGFQLKGSGWYATDFKGGGKKPEAKPKDEVKSKDETKADAKGDAKSEAKAEPKPESKNESKSESKAAA